MQAHNPSATTLRPRPRQRDWKMPKHDDGSDHPWREVRSLAGSIAESLMLAAASGNELRPNEYALAEGLEQDGFALAQRFIAEAQIGALVSIGHRLINLVARAPSRDRGIAKRVVGEGAQAKSV